MKFDRAWRRAQTARLKKNRKNYWWFTTCVDEEKTPRQLGILIDTPKPCSCWMCGNPRRKQKEKPFSQVKAEQTYERYYHVASLDFLRSNHEQNLSPEGCRG